MMTENINAHIYLLLKLFTGMPCGHGSSSPPLVQVPGDDAVELIINTFLWLNHVVQIQVDCVSLSRLTWWAEWDLMVSQVQLWCIMDDVPWLMGLLN
jgi:hypothetical protein